MENEPGPTGENAVMNAGTAGNTDDTDWNADFFWNAGDADFFGTRMTQVTRIFFGTRMTRMTRFLFWNAGDAGDADFILERG
jgi:hypothetical protein